MCLPLSELCVVACDQVEGTCFNNFLIIGSDASTNFIRPIDLPLCCYAAPSGRGTVMLIVCCLLHPHQVKFYRIGCVGSGLVFAKALTE